MTILSVIRNVSSVIALSRPEVVFSSTEREHFELQVLANTAADHIAKDYEWQVLKVLATLPGDGSTTAFAFPTDYDRMLKDNKLWSSRVQTPLTHIVSTDRWLEIDIRQFAFVTGAWTIFGDQINIKPAPVTGETVKFFYMSKLWAANEAGAAKAAFEQDTDTFRLSEKLLELCMIWKWRAQKGLPYAQDEANYEDAKEKLIVKDKGSSILRVGPTRMPRGVSIAYPVPIVP